MSSVSNIAKTVTVLSTAFVLVILINVTYMLYHLYMKKKAEFSNRLLNVLYSQFAIIAQLGSFIIFLLIFHILGLIGSEHEVLVVIMLMRQVQLLMAFYYLITISIANMLHTFKMSLYLHLSCNRHGYIYVFVTILFAR